MFDGYPKIDPVSQTQVLPIDEVMIGAPRTMPMLATRSQSHDDLHFAASLSTTLPGVSSSPSVGQTC